MSLHTAPTRVENRRANAELRVDWADDHVTVLPWWYLRGYCPCAVCQGHGNDWDFVGAAKRADLALIGIEEVGHYALNFVWQDGHRTGIYTFESLRTLCPCDACRQAQGAAHPWRRMEAAKAGTAASA